MAKKKSIGSWF